MPTYFEAPDGHMESCLWTTKPERPPLCVVREQYVHPGFWPDVVARMTGTVLINDDATVKRVAMALLICEAGPDATEFVWDDKYTTRARAILAALTVGPHA